MTIDEEVLAVTVVFCRDGHENMYILSRVLIHRVESYKER